MHPGIFLDGTMVEAYLDYLGVSFYSENLLIPFLFLFFFGSFTVLKFQSRRHLLHLKIACNFGYFDVKTDRSSKNASLEIQTTSQAGTPNGRFRR